MYTCIYMHMYINIYIYTSCANLRLCQCLFVCQPISGSVINWAWHACVVYVFENGFLFKRVMHHEIEAQSTAPNNVFQKFLEASSLLQWVTFELTYDNLYFIVVVLLHQRRSTSCLNPLIECLNSPNPCLNAPAGCLVPHIECLNPCPKESHRHEHGTSNRTFISVVLQVGLFSKDRAQTCGSFS